MAMTQFPLPSGMTPRSKNSTAVSLRNKEDPLPELRSSNNQIDKSKPLPTTLQSEFLPEDVLLAITQPPPQYEKLGPPSRYRNLDTSAGVAKKKPAGLWTHPKSRDRFKHLTQNTPCVCGAGRDVSFLYDVPPKEDKRQKTDQFDPTEVRKDEEEIEKPKKKAIRLPDTLIPEEYHVVKNKGVMGLEYYEDSFGTHPNDHECHLVVFPSMNPTSRYEVAQLKKTLNDMMTHAGLDESDFKLEGPTQMHNLLEIIRKEQDIYSVVFHELIRQVSIECLERGELLSEVRSRYSNLVSKIPRQIKGLHEEVLAQRALDRRLTEELMRFKSTISHLTSELTEVKEHDKRVTAEAKEAQEGLRSALAESQKNASLLAEYHDLYELQRQRLEKQVRMLSEEKEVWSTAAYNLALKVTDEHSLNTAKRLHVNEKAWAKLANHFSIMLSDKDTEILTRLQGFVDKWRDLVAEFHASLSKREDTMREQVKLVHSGVKHWHDHFRKHVLSKDGHFQRAPDTKRIGQLYEHLKKFQEILAAQNELFGGDTLLAGQDMLNEVKYQVAEWTDCAIAVFSRHRGDKGENHPDHEDMIVLNEEMEKLIGQLRIRLTGENGSALGLINTANSMEQWDGKFTALLHGNNPLPEQEWLRFFTSMDDWLQYLADTMIKIGSTQKEDDKFETESIDVVESMRKVQKWLSSATNSIDSEDGKLVEAVTGLHRDMIQWMVQLLLRLAPDREDHSKEAREAILMGSASIAQIQASGSALFTRLHQFTSHVTGCCSGFINAEMQRKLTNQEEDAEVEFNQLKTLQVECDCWIATAKLLLSELLKKCEGEALDEASKLSSGGASIAPGLTPQANEAPLPIGASDVLAPELSTTSGKVEEPVGQQTVFHDKEKLQPKAQLTAERPPPMGGPSLSTATTILGSEAALEILGSDANTHNKTLGSVQAAAGDLAAKPRSASVPDAPDTKKAYEALAAVSSLQEQLLQTEERAQIAEGRKSELEFEVREQLERIQALERQLEALQSGAGAEKSDLSGPSKMGTTVAPTPASGGTQEEAGAEGGNESSSKSPRGKKGGTGSRAGSRASDSGGGGGKGKKK